MMNRQAQQEQLGIKLSGWMPYDRTLSANSYLLSGAGQLDQSRSDQFLEGLGRLVSDQVPPWLQRHRLQL